MKVYLSHGGGVNSWALYLWLIEQGKEPGKDFEAVFVDHGTDWPETYEYMDMMIARGYPVTVVKTVVEGCGTLYEWYKKKKGFPNRLPGTRWCTTEFKINPIKEYYEKPCIELIGFEFGEEGRAKRMVGKAGVEQEYPLIDAGINRQGCVDIIQRHGLPVPIRSGCYICPFQTRGQWIDLKRNHPELFCRAVELEGIANKRMAKQGKKPVYFGKTQLDMLIQPKIKGQLTREEQPTLFDPDFDRPPCRCGL